jgi:hypothetical protein
MAGTMYALKLRDQVLLVGDDVAAAIHAAIEAQQQFVERIALDLGGFGEPHEVTLNLSEIRSLTRVRSGQRRSNVVSLPVRG